MVVFIAAFSSRGQTSRMYDIFQHNNIDCSIVNTPREVGIGCGISLKFSESHLPKARQIMSASGMSSFAGFFRITKNGFSLSVVRI